MQAQLVMSSWWFRATSKHSNCVHSASPRVHYALYNVPTMHSQHNNDGSKQHPSTHSAHGLQGSTEGERLLGSWKHVAFWAAVNMQLDTVDTEGERLLGSFANYWLRENYTTCSLHRMNIDSAPIQPLHNHPNGLLCQWWLPGPGQVLVARWPTMHQCN